MSKLSLTQVDWQLYFQFNISTRLHWTRSFFHWNLVASIGHVCSLTMLSFGFLHVEPGRKIAPNTGANATRISNHTLPRDLVIVEDL